MKAAAVLFFTAIVLAIGGGMLADFHMYVTACACFVLVLFILPTAAMIMTERDLW